MQKNYLKQNLPDELKNKKIISQAKKIELLDFFIFQDLRDNHI